MDPAAAAWRVGAILAAEPVSEGHAPLHPRAHAPRVARLPATCALTAQVVVVLVSYGGIL